MIDFDRCAFWQDPENSGYPGPWIEHCKPEWYLDLDNITDLIVSTLQRYAKPEWSILELGCGTGRNLAGLGAAGYMHLAGIEINQTAVDLGMAKWPALRQIPIVVAPVESVLREMPTVDVIYTQGFLMHLPYALEWVIELLRDKARYVILTNEGEREGSFHAWPHDYQGIVEATGEWRQVEMHSDEQYPPLPATTVKRVFLRRSYANP